MDNSLNLYLIKGECVCGYFPRNMLSWNGHKGKCRKYHAWVESQTGYEIKSQKKTRKFPTAAMLYRRDHPRGSKKDQIQAFQDPVTKDFYSKLESKLSLELQSMEEMELEFHRWNAAYPEKVELDKSTWGYRGNTDIFENPNKAFPVKCDMTKFGQTRAEQRKIFNEYYSAFIKQQMVDIPPKPQILDTDVDLYLLYTHVIRQGGLAKAMQKQSLLGDVGAAMGLTGTIISLGYQLRLIYFTHLLQFEYAYSLDDGAEYKSNWVQDDSGCMSPYIPEEIESNHRRKRKNRGAQPATLREEPYAPNKRTKLGLTLSLKCGQKSDVVWALNRLLFLSYESKKEPLILADTPDLLRVLVELLSPSEQSDSVGAAVTEMNYPHKRQLRVVLRILANLALTASNCKVMLNPEFGILARLLSYLNMSSISIKEDVLRILSHLSGKIALRELLNQEKLLSQLASVIRTPLHKIPKMVSLVLHALQTFTSLCANKRNHESIKLAISNNLLGHLSTLLRIRHDHELLLRACEAVLFTAELCVSWCEFYILKTIALRDLLQIAAEIGTLGSHGVQIGRTAACAIRTIYVAPLKKTNIGDNSQPSPGVLEVLRQYQPELFRVGISQTKGDQVDEKFAYETLAYTKQIFDIL